jgi:UDP-N-acetylmuramoylalanine--D-glutamate ligase
VDHIVVSPGVPPLAALTEAERAGVPISSEIELASWFVTGRIVGITGTNGKSTVTTLIGQMCERAGLPTFVGGNLGRPLVEVVGTPAAGPDGVVVVELSSFQLERVTHLRCHVALLLNVTDDHLDRYTDFAAYVAAKARIFERQGARTSPSCRRVTRSAARPSRPSTRPPPRASSGGPLPAATRAWAW